MIKQLLIFLLAISSSWVAQAQSTVTTWEGELEIPGTAVTLRLNLNIRQKDNGKVKMWLDSPDQKVVAIPCEGSLNAGHVELKSSSINGSFEGDIDDTGLVLSGMFTQNGISMPIQFKKFQGEGNGNAFPPHEYRNMGGDLDDMDETPKPYNEEEFSCTSDGITLAGTITIPKGKGPFPAIVMVAGSGPNDRDETIMGHKPFKAIADSLARHGIASLRYDKRGVGKSSLASGYETTRDFAQDAAAIIDFAASRNQMIDTERLGFLGHSEGASIAIMNHEKAQFIITLAAPAVHGKDLMIKQNQLIVKLQGAKWTPQLDRQIQDIFTAIDTSTSEKTLKAKLYQLAENTPSIRPQIPALSSAWYRSFIKLDPTATLKQVKCPMLALNGEWDCQVDCEQNLGAVEKCVKHAVIKRYPRFNHLFQECGTFESSMNYGAIHEDINPQVINDIKDFILNLDK